MAKATPCVRGETLTYNSNQAIQVGSREWWLWLGVSETASFRFEDERASFTARRERKGGGFYWYAYRRQCGRLHKVYLGRAEELTWERLAKAAGTLSRDATEQVGNGEYEHTGARQGESVGEVASLPLLTKLSLVQPRKELVERPRLYERLDWGVRRKLTFISAPAGFGKTTLISTWRATVQGNSLPLAWVSLDNLDNDPAHFWNYIIVALQRSLGGQLSGLLPAPATPWPSIEAILTTLINALMEVDRNFVLALDDYHLIQEQAIHEQMAFLLEHQPSHMHMLLLSRTEPSLPLVRLRAQGELCELHSADLRFTQQEMMAFLNLVMGLHLSAQEISALGERTEGWIAGLQLAALSIQDRQNVSSFITAFTGSHRHILEYLSVEVLARQPAPIQDFLLLTSLLERLNASLCDAVTLHQDSQGTLVWLEQANLFLIPLDEEYHWYRYHHLFAEFLREQLARLHSDLIPELRRRAIAWYVEHGFLGEAIEHALEGREFVLAVRLIEQTSTDMARRGELMTLLRWLLRCPEDLVRKSPHLSICFAAALGSLGQLEAAEARLNDAQQALQALKADAVFEALSPARLREIECELGAIRTFVVSARADVQGTIESARQTLELLPAEDAFVRSLIGASLVQAYLLAGDLQRAREVCRQTRAYSETSHNIHVLIVGIACEGFVLIFQGRPYAAEEIFQQALHLTNEVSARQLPAVSLVYTGLGVIHYNWNHLEQAVDYLRRGIEFGRSWGHMPMLAQAYTALALALHTTGQTSQAMTLFEEAEQLMRQYSCLKGLSWLQSMRARLWLMQGDQESALGWAQAAGFRVDDSLSYLNEYEHITLVRVLLVQGLFTKALCFLDRLLVHARTEERYQNVTIMLILKALLLARQGQQKQALIELEKALRLGEPANAIRPFVDEGRPMSQLLKGILTRGIFPDYVRRLLAAFSENKPGQVQESGGDLALSEREIDVLRLLAAGHSNQQIARAFVVALSTVKTHLNNIYLKLGVHSRTQAIARAQELRLI